MMPDPTTVAANNADPRPSASNLWMAVGFICALQAVFLCLGALIAVVGWHAVPQTCPLPAQQFSVR